MVSLRSLSVHLRSLTSLTLNPNSLPQAYRKLEELQSSQPSLKVSAYVSPASLEALEGALGVSLGRGPPPPARRSDSGGEDDEVEEDEGV